MKRDEQEETFTKKNLEMSHTLKWASFYSSVFMVIDELSKMWVDDILRETKAAFYPRYNDHTCVPLRQYRHKNISYIYYMQWLHPYCWQFRRTLLIKDDYVGHNNDSAYYTGDYKLKTLSKYTNDNDYKR